MEEKFKKIFKKILIVGIGYFLLAFFNSFFLHFAAGMLDDFGAYKIILSVVTQGYLIPILIGAVILVEFVPKEKVEKLTKALLARY